MRMRPQLVVQSAIAGSFLLGLFGFWITPQDFSVQIAYAPLLVESAAAAAPVGGTLSAMEKNPPGKALPGEECAVSPAYPEGVLRWCRLITQYAGQHQFDPDLIAALILLESGGDPRAYSRSGAVGLMQVMPRDGIAARFECINGPCFASRPTIRELEDPEFNVSYGTRFLAGLLKRQGDLREALKAYGPMDVGYRYSDQVLAIWERYRR